MVQESQSYIIPIIPRLAPKVLVSGEHHVLNDLLSNKKARAAYAKARQDRLDQREKKHQEGTLRQAPSVSCQATNSTARPLLRESLPFNLLGKRWTYLHLIFLFRFL